MAKLRNYLFLILPGILMAATGVGAGDLATASFSGSHLGVAVLWAVVVGSLFKYVLTEGLTRWQLVTGQTLLEGLADKLGPVFGWLFLPYLLLWSFFVGAALMGACGVTLHAIFPVFDDASEAKVIFGIVCSLSGLVMVLLGGFRLFERVMAVCIAIMFTVVLVTALLLWPGTTEVVQGLLVPVIPEAEGKGLGWTVALIGGVGGTLTILCYGYWIREVGRDSVQDIRTCRIDLSVAYLLTAVFGIAMVIIGSNVELDGKGAGLLVQLADTLADTLAESLGQTGRWLFLIGAFGAVFSSLLGVWQAVPYLFADIYRLCIVRDGIEKVDTRAAPYRAYLFAIALVPMLGLVVSFSEMQKLYAIIGASFLPLLAIALLVLNGRRRWLGAHANRWPSVIGLGVTVAFSIWVALQKWF